MYGVRVDGENGRQGIDDMLDALVAGQQAERQDLVLPSTPSRSLLAASTGTCGIPWGMRSILIA